MGPPHSSRVQEVGDSLGQRCAKIVAVETSLFMMIQRVHGISAPWWSEVYCSRISGYLFWRRMTIETLWRGLLIISLRKQRFSCSLVDRVPVMPNIRFTIVDVNCSFFRCCSPASRYRCRYVDLSLFESISE